MMFYGENVSAIRIGISSNIDTGS